MNEMGYPFHIDPVITDQFFGHFSNPSSAGPEKELFAAVLADAFDCYCKYSRSRKQGEIRLFQEAQEWIFAENEDSPLSFVSVCDALTLNPKYLRQKLLDHKNRGVARMEKSASNPRRETSVNARASDRRRTKRVVRRRRKAQSS